METLPSQTLVYDNNCPLCTWYTDRFVKTGVLEKGGRVSFEEISNADFCRLDLNRARHEIPLIDKNTGNVLYGLDGLVLVIGSAYPRLKPLTKSKALLKCLNPLYHFISYNRRIIAGSASQTGLAPDFNLAWRLAFIVTGVCYTAFCILIFAALMGISTAALFGFVSLYFLALVLSDMVYNHTPEQKWDYIGHLAMLGFIEGTLFVLTALLARFTGLTGLMFAGQGAGRLLAVWLHSKRTLNNNYSAVLNYVFATGAVGLVIVIAIIKNV